MRNFRLFAAAIAAQFQHMSQFELFRVDIDGDKLWEMYLASFPEGTNPMFRKRTEHDASYDRSFVRKLGNVIAINANGKIITIWDARDLQTPYDVVASTLAQFVRAAPIKDLFRIGERKVGQVFSKEDRGPGEPVHTWHHFWADIDSKHFMVNKDIDTFLGDARTTVQVFERGLLEISKSSLETVRDLIQEGNIYRGDQWHAPITEFLDLRNKFDALPSTEARQQFVWHKFSRAGSIARLRNTSMGQLLQALTNGEELETAVKEFERMVAPTNYKRPTALITKRMVEDAEKTITELGLEHALERRFAQLSDISVNNVLWVDGQAQNQMQGGSSFLGKLLEKEISTPKPQQSIQNNISIEDFEQSILPTAIGVELFFGNQHEANLMSLTTAQHQNVGRLFQWDNDFAWSYKGNITDSIKEKVKAAGGNIDAKLRVSLAWFNLDDLDIHCDGPDGVIYFGQPYGQSQSVSGRRILDVDMNVSSPKRGAVENLSWQLPRDGQYKIYVDNYNCRERDHLGFTLEVENDGKVTQFSYPRLVGRKMACLQFTVSKQRITELKILDKQIIGQGISREVWGIPTEGFVKVDTIVHSPNYWGDNRVGNKHWFFIINGCKNDEPARGIYNEYLKPDLAKHRKVFEVLGNKTKCELTSNQLSGLGFSSTKRDTVLARVTDRSNSTRIYQIQF